MANEPQTTDTGTFESNGVIERNLVVINKMGIHARPATKIVETATGFKSDLTLLRNGEEIDAKSIFGVMTLAALQGEGLTIRACGEDALEALDAIEALFKDGFGELEEDAQRAAEKTG